MHPVLWHHCLYFSSISVQKVHTKHIGWEQFEFIIQLLIMLCAWCDKCMKLHCFLWQEHPTIINSQQPGPPSNLWGPHQPPVQGIISSPEEHRQTSSHTHPERCWEPHPRLCLLQTGLLERTSQWVPQQEHPETATQSKTVLPGSCSEHRNMNTSHPPCSHNTGFLSPPGYGLMFQCIHGNAPQYLRELLHSVRSTNSYRLLPCTLGDQTFPEHLGAPQMIDSLLKGLKTYLSFNL